MALEETFQTAVNEKDYAEAQTIADLERLVTGRDVAVAPSSLGSPVAAGEVSAFPTWTRSLAARFVRRVSLFTWILPVTHLLAWVHVEGIEQVQKVDGPVVFAANHLSHLDTPVIFAALPAQRRYRLAPAAQKEFFAAHFSPGRYGPFARLANSLAYYLAALLFQAFPLPQREPGTRETLRYIGDLVSEGCSILIYPEGKRSTSGRIEAFQAGVSMIASRLRVPVIPVRLRGPDRIMPPGRWLPHPGRVRVAFGSPLRLEGDNYTALARQVEEAIRNL